MRPSRRAWFAFVALIPIVMAGAFAAGFGGYLLRGRPEVDAPANRSTSKPLLEVWDIIHTDFYGPVPDDQRLTYAAIRGVLAELNDPYTVLVEPQPHQQETAQLQGHYGGIGATLSRDEQGRVRLNPFPDSPAAQAGVQLDDVLAAIDGVAVGAEEPIASIDGRLSGEVGTQVTLSIERAGGERRDIAVTRGDIAIPSVTARLLREDPAIGYVAITHFSARTEQELKDALGKLRAQGARKLVLDLRDNGGGLLDGAVSVASQFLAQGVVVYEVVRGNTTFYPVAPGGVATDLPLVVLVNHGSASATELVAGALQDQGRALLVGEPTFGKGSVQLVFDLRDGSSLHVTKAKWLTPQRRSIDGTGLMPDIIVSPTPADTAAGRDVQLLRAIELLQAK